MLRKIRFSIMAFFPMPPLPNAAVHAEDPLDVSQAVTGKQI
jgi:hypothetical protein